MNIQSLNQLGLQKQKALIEDISDQASKEYSNSSTMNKLKEDWKGLEFPTVPVEGKDSPIL